MYIFKRKNKHNLKQMEETGRHSRLALRPPPRGFLGAPPAALWPRPASPAPPGGSSDPRPRGFGPKQYGLLVHLIKPRGLVHLKKKTGSPYTAIWFTFHTSGCIRICPHAGPGLNRAWGAGASKRGLNHSSGTPPYSSTSSHLVVWCTLPIWLQKKLRFKSPLSAPKDLDTKKGATGTLAPNKVDCSFVGLD